MSEQELLERIKDLEKQNAKLEGELLLLRSCKKSAVEELMASMPGFAFIKDKDLNYVSANKTFCDLLKVPYKEIEGKTDFDIFPKDLAEKYRLDDKKVLATKKPVLIEEITTDASKPGSRFVIATRKIPWFNKNGEIIGLYGLGFDISELQHVEELKKAKRRAEINEKKLHSYIQEAPYGILFSNQQGILIEVNKTACQITGYSKKELIDLSVFEIFHPENLMESKEGFQQLLETGKAGGEYAYVTKSKEKRFWRIDAVKLSENLFVGFIKDITESVHDKRELYIAKQMAENANSLKAEFIKNLSHEIRTPMNGIMGFTKMLDIPSISSDKRKHYSNQIHSSCKQLLKIIDNLIEISLLDGNIKGVIESEFCLNELLEEICSLFNLKSKERNLPIHINKTLEDKDSYIFTDKEKVQKVLLNLLENAFKFTNSGKIELTYLIKGRTLVISVKDSGVGISPEKQKIIFERFVQENINTSHTHGGLGLGLSISQENAKLIGGAITVDSEKGKGATFHFKIPYKPVKS